MFCNTVLDKMHVRLSRRVDKILNEIDLMETRIITLERGQKQFRGELPSKLQVDTAALIQELNHAKIKFAEDVSIWRLREEALIRKIDLTTRNVLVQVDCFEKIESENLKRVKDDLSIMKCKKENEEILKSISEIRQAIQLEEEERKFSDDEILNSVNSYTIVLQRGLQQVVYNN